LAYLTFLKQKFSCTLSENTELVRAPHLNPNIPLKFGCGQGKCGTCAIKIKAGIENLSPMTKQEKETIDRLGLSSHRLACQCALTGDVVIDA